MTSHDDGRDDDGPDDDPFRFKMGLPFFCQVESDSRILTAMPSMRMYPPR